MSFPVISSNNSNSLSIDDCGLVVTVTTDRDVYYPGQPVKITISVTNNGPDTTLVFADSQLADFRITDALGRHVYWWSVHFMFFQMVIKWPIKHGQTIVLLEWVWFKLRDFYPFFDIPRFPVFPGKYCITGWMCAAGSHDMIEGIPIELTLRFFRFF